MRCEKVEVFFSGCLVWPAYLRPAQFVATENPFATRSLAIPIPMSPMDRMPTVASLDDAIVSLQKDA